MIFFFFWFLDLLSSFIQKALQVQQAILTGLLAGKTEMLDKCHPD